MLNPGYTLFYVDDVEKSILFYKNAFGLESGFVDKENKQFGELITGSTKLGLFNTKQLSAMDFNMSVLAFLKIPLL